MRKQPFFSVIIPVYNRELFIGKAIGSVLEQTFRDFELIIINDGSTDRTGELISAYKDERVIYKEQEKQGVSRARNRGLELANGAFIAFLDSDDWWLSDKLAKAAEHIKKYPGIKIFHTEEIWHRRGEVLPQKPRHHKPAGNVYKKALRLCCISISTAVIKRDVFTDIGVFDETLEACEDYDLWLRAAIRYEVKLIPEALTEKDGGRPDQLSSSVWGLDRFRIKALEKMLNAGNLDNDHYQCTLSELEKKCAIFAKGSEKRGKYKEAAYYKNLPLKYARLRA
ncbi:MAG: glycosyltransferase [Candidatus Omnitrophota bacterium]